MLIFYFESVFLTLTGQANKCVWFFHNILNASWCYGNELLLCEILKNLQIKVKIQKLKLPSEVEISTSGIAEASQVPIGEK